MRSYDGYRALIVLATILAHMTGTLTVHVAGNKTKRQSGESSSSAPILSLSFSASYSLSPFPLHCTSVSPLPRRARKRSLPPSSGSHAARSASFIFSSHLFLPPSPSSWCGRIMSDSSSAFLMRAIPFLHSTFFPWYTYYI